MNKKINIRCSPTSFCWQVCTSIDTKSDVNAHALLWKQFAKQIKEELLLNVHLLAYFLRFQPFLTVFLTKCYLLRCNVWNWGQVMTAGHTKGASSRQKKVGGLWVDFLCQTFLIRTFHQASSCDMADGVWWVTVHEIQSYLTFHD